MKLEDVREWLLSFGEKEDWVRHSLLVAKVARGIAKALEEKGVDISQEKVEIGALIHDIGRSKSHRRHPLEGYYLLQEKGLGEYAHFCLSHYLKGRDWQKLKNEAFWSEEELKEWEAIAPGTELSLEEKVVIYADGICLSDQIVSLLSRIEHWKHRYGPSPWLMENEKILKNIEEELHTLLGRAPEEVLQNLDFFPLPKEAPQITHFTPTGAAKMVDISEKEFTLRTAKAFALVRMKEKTKQIALQKEGKKGDVFQVARIAAILAAKRTDELIPLCHTLPLSSLEVKFYDHPQGIGIETVAKATYATGVEMEALTAASLAALTLYDMLKAVDKEMEISSICLLEKTGGKTGDFHRGREMLGRSLEL